MIAKLFLSMNFTHYYVLLDFDSFVNYNPNFYSLRKKTLEKWKKNQRTKVRPLIYLENCRIVNSNTNLVLSFEKAGFGFSFFSFSVSIFRTNSVLEQHQVALVKKWRDWKLACQMILTYCHHLLPNWAWKELSNTILKEVWENWKRVRYNIQTENMTDLPTKCYFDKK